MVSMTYPLQLVFNVFIVWRMDIYIINPTIDYSKLVLVRGLFILVVLCCLIMFLVIIKSPTLLEITIKVTCIIEVMIVFSVNTALVLLGLTVDIIITLGTSLIVE